MSSSTYGGAVRWDVESVGALAGALPVDAGIVADAIINNAAHFVDEQCQPLASWISPSSAAEYLEPDAASEVTPSIVTILGPLPIQLRADGSCPLVIAAIAASVAGGATATIYACLRPYAAPTSNTPAVTVSADHSSNGRATFASGTPAWSTSPIELQLSQAQVDAATRSISTLRSAGSDPGYDALITLAQIEIYALTSDDTQTPRVYGWMAREYCGV